MAITFANAMKNDTVAGKLNKLRAGVLGANDGIVSVAATVIGVAAARPADLGAIAIAGFAALSAGAFSMSTGEYISVSTQRDTEEAIIERVQRESASAPENLIRELAEDFQARGVAPQVARQAAEQLTASDAVDALSRKELLDPNDLVSPWAAALASFFAFIVGAALPVASILLFPAAVRIPLTFVTVLLALALTGYVSARLGEADPRRAIIRTVLGGGLGMAVTFGVGLLFQV